MKNLVNVMEKNSGMTASKLFIMLLQVICFCIFAGRAYQHLVWDAPFRTLLWDQEIMQGVIESLTSMTWEQYTTSPLTDQYIQGSIQATGWLYAICAMLSLFIRKSMKWAGYILLGGALSLTFLGFLSFKDKFYQVGEFMEHMIQIASPVLLFMVLFTKMQAKKLIVVAKAAVALTFIGHGLYAWGYYPQPGPFVDMLINILGFSEDFARSFLKVAAVLDFIVAVTIFIPRAARISLMYCVVWGLLTAMARVVSGFDSNFIAQSLNQYTFETVYRLGHGLLPLWIFLTEGKRQFSVSKTNEKRTNTAVAAVAAH